MGQNVSRPIRPLDLNQSPIPFDQLGKLLIAVLQIIVPPTVVRFEPVVIHGDNRGRNRRSCVCRGRRDDDRSSQDAGHWWPRFVFSHPTPNSEQFTNVVYVSKVRRDFPSHPTPRKLDLMHIQIRSTSRPQHKTSLMDRKSSLVRLLDLSFVCSLDHLCSLCQHSCCRRSSD